MDEGITEYERKRLANIQRNLEFMKTMGVSSAKMAARTSVGRPKPAKVPTKRPASSKKPVRKSRRLRGEEVQYKLPVPTNIMSVEELEERRFVRKKRERRRFAADLYGKASGGSGSDSVSSDEQESDLEVDASGLDDIVEYRLAPEDTGIIKNCAKSIAFLPRKDKAIVVYGDTKGELGFWTTDQSIADNRNSPVVTLKQHKDHITQICFNPNDDSKLVSASNDGTAKQLDVLTGASTELYRGESMVTSMTVENSLCTYLFSCEDNITRLDTRDPKSMRTSNHLHESKINTVHSHPLQPYCIATASRDRTAKLWDLRQMKTINTEPVAVMPHFRNVGCAYFSPDGAHLVTVSQDGFLHIYDSSTATFSNPRTVAPMLVIPHSSRYGKNGEQFARFYASWDPKHTTRFVIGSLQTPRRLKIFDATKKNPVQELQSSLFNSVHAINVFHPTLPLIACGSTSSRMCLWREV